MTKRIMTLCAAALLSGCGTLAPICDRAPIGTDKFGKLILPDCATAPLVIASAPDIDHATRRDRRNSGATPTDTPIIDQARAEYDQFAERVSTNPPHQAAPDPVDTARDEYGAFEPSGPVLAPGHPEQLSDGNTGLSPTEIARKRVNQAREQAHAEQRAINLANQAVNQAARAARIAAQMGTGQD